MTHFSSLSTAPAETRRTLRQRFHRCIPSTYVHPMEPRGSSKVTDEIFLQLLLNLTFDFNAELKRARAFYCNSRGPGSAEASFDDLIDKGWIQLIWGRISIPTDVAVEARNSLPESMNSYIALSEQRFSSSYVWSPEVTKNTELTNLVNRINSGDLSIDDISCQTPSWVAARLWDRTYLLAAKPSHALRLWVDRWKLLGSPDMEIARAWNEQALTAFRESVICVLAEDSCLCSFEDFRNDLIKRVALTGRQDIKSIDEYIPRLPATLIERALWLRDLSIERLVDENYLQLEEYAHLISLLEEEIADAEYSSAPHPTYVRLVNMGLERAPMFSILLMHAQRNPSLIVELLLHPPTSAVACLLIAQWQSPTSAWDRTFLDRENQANKLIAFSDAVSILRYHVTERGVDPREASGLLRWLHHKIRSSGEGQKANFEEMLARLTTELVRLPQEIMCNVIETLLEDPNSRGLETGNFHAALNAISMGGLADRVDPTGLVEGYVSSYSKDEGLLSAAGITPRMAVILHTLAERTSETLYNKFLSPVDITKRLNARTEENQFIVAHDIGQAVRTHIRVLCRVVLGLSGSPPRAIWDALVSAVRAGAVTDFDNGRVAAFSPNFGARSFFESQDRPIAADIAGVLRTAAEADTSPLMNVLLETDEPTVLAQLLTYCPVAIQRRIRARIAEITPDDAAPTCSLDEVQVRIDALLTAGLAEVAGKYIEDERGLRTRGEVPGRISVRFRQSLRVMLLKEDWRGINGAELPGDLSPGELQSARETLSFYQAVAALNNPAADRSRAVELFSRLHERSGDVAAYAINLFLAQIGKLLGDGQFEILEDHRTAEAENVLIEGEVNVRRIQGLEKSDADIYMCYRSLLLLALQRATEAHEILGSIDSMQIKDTALAFDSVAMTRMGRQSEAVVMLNEAVRAFGETPQLRAAKSYIETGSGRFHLFGITPDDQLVPSTREAFVRLKQMDPLQQAQVLKLWDPAFEGLVTDIIVSAATSVENLVPAMRNLILDLREDDITALIRELLTGHLEVLGWQVADHSREGWSSRGNSGEPDLVLRSGSTTLSVVEAVVCKDAIRDDNLRAHFHKVFGYSSCSINFLLTYTFRDALETMRRLRNIAESCPPDGFQCKDIVDAASVESAPRRFHAIYSSGARSVRMVFLVVDLKQDDRKRAAKSAIASSRRRRHRPG